jgi:hypothetical protein
MPTERQIQKAIEFCAATMDRFQAARRMPYASIEMAAETQAQAFWILHLASRSPSAADRVLRSVEDELVSRYGRDIGGRLNREFLQAFDSFGTSLLEASMEDSMRIHANGNGNGNGNGKGSSIPNSRERSDPIEAESHP